VSGQIRTSLTFLRSALCPLSLITVITHTGGTNGMQCEEEHTLKKERRPPPTAPYDCETSATGPGPPCRVCVAGLSVG
jgi:hypothetical protein